MFQPQSGRASVRVVRCKARPQSRPNSTPEVGTEVGTARAFPAVLAHLAHGVMRVSAWLRRVKLPGLDSNQQPSG
jgi:hypothetical protein